MTGVEQEPIEAIEAERPDWLPSRFKSAEELVKSYLHASQKITEQGQELAVARGEIERLEGELNYLLSDRRELEDRIASLEQAYIRRAAL